MEADGFASPVRFRFRLFFRFCFGPQVFFEQLRRQVHRQRRAEQEPEAFALVSCCFIRRIGGAEAGLRRAVRKKSPAYLLKVPS
jgi:hypothetical protein